MGDGELNPSEVKVVAAADVHLVNVVHALRHQPVADFKVADYEATGAFGDGHRIGDVVCMTMREDDRVGINGVGGRVSRGDRVILVTGTGQ